MRLPPALAAAGAAACLAAAASASVVLRVTPRELADTAGLVVEGRVAAVDVRWDARRTCINTYATFNVERTHKGTPVASVIVKVPGGRVGEEEVRVEGTARFAVGEEALLFLWKDGAGEWIVLGEAQGKFRLYRDEKAGKRMAENSLKGLCLVVREDPKSAAAAAARRTDCLSYDDLVAVVKGSVDAQRARAPGTPSNGTGTAPAPKPGEPAATTPPAGRVPAPPAATPDPPSTTTPPDGGAPPPTKEDPAPPTGDPDTAKDAPPPAPTPAPQPAPEPK
jgi:hypothetical protein